MEYLSHYSPINTALMLSYDWTVAVGGRGLANSQFRVSPINQVPCKVCALHLLASTSTNTHCEIVAPAAAADVEVMRMTGQSAPVRESDDSLIDSERDVNEPLVCPTSVKWQIQSCCQAPLNLCLLMRLEALINPEMLPPMTL